MDTQNLKNHQPDVNVAPEDFDVNPEEMGNREWGVGSSQNSPTPYSPLPTPSPDEFTPDEIAEITGYQPEQVELIDREFMLERDSEVQESRDSSENPLVRFSITSLLVGSVLLFGWLIWSIFFAVKSPRPKVAATPTPTPTTTAATSDEAARLKAELAFRNQVSRSSQPTLPAPTPAAKPSPKPTQSSSPARVVREPAPPPRIIREPAPPPRIIREPAPPPKIVREPAPPPKIIRERVPMPQPQVAAAPAPQAKAEDIDPFERWNQLATIGQQAAETEIASVPTPTSIEPAEASVSPNSEQVAQAVPTSIPVVSIGGTTSVATAPTDGSYPPQEDEEVSATPKRIEEDALSGLDSTLEDAQRERQGSVESVAMKSPTSEPPRLAASSSIPSSECQNTSTSTTDCNSVATQPLTPGELGILNRKPILDAESTVPIAQTLPMQVQIGTSAKAKVLVPMIWTEEKKGNQGRFAVELEEDVLSTDNRVALPKGTILITEVDAVAAANRLVKQSVVAVVYPDRSGQIRQQSIPKNSILVRGEDGEPLIAKELRNKGGEIAQQEILMGLLSAAGRASEVMNQNKTQSSTLISSGGFNSQTLTTKARNPNVLAAAVEGFFKPMSQRLSRRAERANQEMLKRSNVAVVPQGTEVSVFFNTFFEVTR